MRSLSSEERFALEENVPGSTIFFCSSDQDTLDALVAAGLLRRSTRWDDEPDPDYWDFYETTPRGLRALRLDDVAKRSRATS